MSVLSRRICRTWSRRCYLRANVLQPHGRLTAKRLKPSWRPCRLPPKGEAPQPLSRGHVNSSTMAPKSTRSTKLTRATTKGILGGMAALLGVREAANVLGVHENTLRRWAEKGYLKPVVNPSGVRRFRLDEIQRLRSRMYDG